MPIEPILCGIKSDAPVDVIGAEETDIYASVASGFKVFAHLNGVVLVVSWDDDAAMILGQFATLVKVNVGPIRNVKAEALYKGDELALTSEEFATSIAGVGPVETDRIGSTLGSGVDAGATPTVIGLPGGHRALYEYV